MYGKTKCFACVVEMLYMYSMKHQCALCKKSWFLQLNALQPLHSSCSQTANLLYRMLHDLQVIWQPLLVCFNADHYSGTCTYSNFSRHDHEFNFTLHIQTDLTAVLAKDVTSNDWWQPMNTLNSLRCNLDVYILTSASSSLCPSDSNGGSFSSSQPFKLVPTYMHITWVDLY